MFVPVLTAPNNWSANFLTSDNRQITSIPCHCRRCALQTVAILNGIFQPPQDRPREPVRQFRPIACTGHW